MKSLRDWTKLLSVVPVEAQFPPLTATSSPSEYENVSLKIGLAHADVAHQAALTTAVTVSANGRLPRIHICTSPARRAARHPYRATDKLLPRLHDLSDHHNRAKRYR